MYMILKTGLRARVGVLETVISAPQLSSQDGVNGPVSGVSLFLTPEQRALFLDVTST
jgi:hypothetical protein